MRGRRALQAWLAPLLVSALATCGGRGATVTPKLFSYKVVRELVHSTSAFTEGLAFREWDGKLVESTGLSGGSKLMLYNIDKEGISVEKEVNFPSRHFGEGIEFFDGKLYSLTWKNRRMHVFDRHTLELIDGFHFDLGIYEGWGLTVAPDRSGLISGDGSEMLHRIDLNHGSPRISAHLAVRDCANDMPRVRGINELELIPRVVSHPEQVPMQHVNHPPARFERLRANELYHNETGSNSTVANVSPGEDPPLTTDLIWGNIISTMCVAMINPDSGDVEGWLLLDDIYDKVDTFNKVANGIAYRAIDGTLWVTGKDWEKLFQIELVDHPDPSSIDIAKACRTRWHLGYSALRSPGNDRNDDRCGSTGNAH
ncbi:Glutamine cyclotransferase, putative [Hondaea fermentalgiana]|uniref:Glutamine cyclotransferase, putative n=1 Tax=Hondaea fermentalgiana TaxID=2315210 RepID=A0A2R5GTM1_9STRA|nr:Glutamine cyclotransferase, putative [Hondaea fermentalgiana]|eukprot:GBG31234.1 Glutamine cyclotransferase, putative [Hondaea fermentalgiana]